MPPASPVDGFSVQFASGRILETYPAVVKEGRQFPISLTADRGPLTLQWNVVGRTGHHITLSDGENGKKMKTIELAGSGTSANLKTGMNRLILRVDGGLAIPREYSLSQNYPNPFNPSTQVLVGLPEASHLEIAVYNVLGQKVTTLVDEDRDAGYHTIVWNGTTEHGIAVSSGVYFIRVNADNPSSGSGGSGQRLNAIRKVVMMK